LKNTFLASTQCSWLGYCQTVYFFVIYVLCLLAFGRNINKLKLNWWIKCVDVLSRSAPQGACHYFHWCSWSSIRIYFKKI